MAANAWGHHDTGSKSQSNSNLGHGGNVKGGFIETWLVNKNKGDNYVVIWLLWVTSLVVPYVIQRTFKNDRISLLNPRWTVLCVVLSWSFFLYIMSDVELIRTLSIMLSLDYIRFRTGENCLKSAASFILSLHYVRFRIWEDHLNCATLFKLSL